MELSVVIPVYNEEESIRPLYDSLVKALDRLLLEYEIILVDDGSRDKTFFNTSAIAQIDHRVKVIKLKRNYGQTTGLHAGLQYASGKVIVTMDGDLQNDPDDIQHFLSKINEGNDIVLGWRHQRKDFLISRKIPSKIANWLITKITRVPVKDNGCAIRAYRAEIIKKFPMYSEMHRLMPVITALSGAKFSQIKVKHHPRKFGSSKYGLSRIYKVLIDMTALKIIFTFFHLPLYGFGIFAVLSGIICLLTFIYALVDTLYNPGGTIVILMGVGILFGSLSVFLVFIGIISDLIYKSGDIKIDKLLKTR
jgi:glycosyltransferase involved in cell wall biosynthesis